MDIKEYKYILTVIQCGSISGAAKKLNISQPSLSMYIRGLEDKSGIKFFYKVEGNLRLTSAGKLYIDYAQKIVDLDAALSRDLRNIQNLDGGEVTIGVTATRGTFCLHEILPLLKKHYPAITVKLIETASAHQLEELVHHRHVDFGLANFPFRHFAFDYDELFPEEIVMAVPADSPVLEQTQSRPECSLPWIDLRILKDENFILLKQGQRMRQAANDLFAAARYEPKIRLETSSAITACNLAAAGMGLAFITSTYLTINPGSGLKLLSVGEPPIIYKFTAAYESKETLSPSAQALINVIKEFYKPERMGLL
ncbi:LysR family transcriptional regulator [Breznakiella homolactica]|uniref:LysR family transcriptional regulator n=1 Tax=Breznakiella homolactica TaxID=2798577 RepID=A0A7T7XPI9_9SPIR|nr:LysR family transcriptional regulator [Breznakiella homolactica]QQO10156.1 LysR family transcriptional regulator [Breznakiella homolactica]